MLANEIFDFKLVRGDHKEKFPVSVLKWDQLGIEVKLDFDHPLNISSDSVPDKIEGKIKKESFALFIS